MNVSNRKCIRRISFRSMKSAMQRNIIAVIAIALTSIMFTSLFTIVMSISYAFEQSNFRQLGGYAHGGFKYLNEEQVEELKTDRLIKEYGLRRFVGIPEDAPFDKVHAEVSYCDNNTSKWMLLDLKEGSYPEENTNEAATDTKVLSLLGIEKKIGTEFTLTFNVDGKETTETFILSGWWDYDEAVGANHILIPKSRTDEIFNKLGTEFKDGITGSYNMDVMFANSSDIEGKVLKVLENHGYQNDDRTADNYIPIGVNWGYVSTHFSSMFDAGTAVAVIALLILIVFTGYLIIYNVFQISVSNDIRFYGLLKTIGTTARQIKRMVFIQAMMLSLFGIPIGLIFGYAIGMRLVPVVMHEFDGLKQGLISFSPWIFIFAAVFSFVTVLISCRKPSSAAAKVSPIEALRFTGNNGMKKNMRKSKSGASIMKMAFANLGRCRGKTIVTILSMSLAIVLFNMTFTFVSGFDMDKYVSTMMAADYLVSGTDYFQTSSCWGRDNAVPEQMIDDIGSISSDGGRTYGEWRGSSEFISPEYYRSKQEKYYDDEILDNWIKEQEKDGLIEANVQLYGMEKYCLDKVNVLNGDISKLYGNENYIAAVYSTDDYGKVKDGSNWAKIGDKVRVCYYDYEYFDTVTGKVYDEENILDSTEYDVRKINERYVEYEVAAIIDIPSSLTYRYYCDDEFVLGADVFKRDTETSDIMYYIFEVPDGKDAEAEEFLANYTEKIMPQFDYESKATYAGNFKSMKSMFMILGGTLSIIIGMVGVLNFINAILTEIFTRRREFAVLQSVGMTGKQLNRMLVAEGLYYSLGAVLLSFVLNIVVGPAVAAVLSSLFWFFSYKLIVIPIIAVIPFFALLGIILPMITYHYASKKSIVERLRETE